MDDKSKKRKERKVDEEVLTDCRHRLFLSHWGEAGLKSAVFFHGCSAKHVHLKGSHTVQKAGRLWSYEM